LQRNFTSTTSAVTHYEGPSSSVNDEKPVNFDPKGGTSLSQNFKPQRKIWDPLNISGTIRDRKVIKN